MLYKGGFAMFKPYRRYRKRRNLPFKHVLLITTILFSIFTFVGLRIIDKSITPSLMTIASTQADQIGSYAINYGIGKKTLNDLTNDSAKLDNPQKIAKQLATIKYNKEGYPVNVTPNTVAITQYMTETENRIQWFLRMVERGNVDFSNSELDDVTIKENPKKHSGVVAEIPLGEASHNALLSNLGPRVPINMELISDVKVNVVSKVTALDITTNYYRLYLQVRVDINVIIPFAVKAKPITRNVPIFETLVKGPVPSYYQDGNGAHSTPALPLPKK